MSLSGLLSTHITIKPEPKLNKLYVPIRKSIQDIFSKSQHQHQQDNHIVTSICLLALSCYSNKDVVAVDFLHWCKDKVRHKVARMLEVMANRQAGT